MRRKSFFIVGIVLAVVTLQSCSSSKPEEGLLKKYFQASQMKDIATMSSIAIEPINIEVASWKITSVTPERADAATLPALVNKEKELKKKVEDHGKVVLDADDAQYAANKNYESARTAANKKAMEEAKANYDKERELHKQMQKEANDAASLSKKEEEITLSSLGVQVQQLANIRDLNGQIFAKESDINIKAKDGSEKNYRVYFRRYEIKDEATNVAHRGRYIIIKFEPIS